MENWKKQRMLQYTLYMLQYINIIMNKYIIIPKKISVKDSH